MKSMTGFGRECADFEDFSVSVDVSSVNKKGLEISVSLPREWGAMERLIGAELKRRFSRGKFNVALNVEFKLAESGVFADADMLAASLAKLRDFCGANGIDPRLTSADVLELNRQLSEKSVRRVIDVEAQWGKLLPVFAAACEKLDEMRGVEGAALKLDLAERVGRIKALVARARVFAAESPAKYRESLMQKLAAIGLNLDFNDERVLKEVCIFADKCDVAEELTRLESHVAQFYSIIELDEAVGRKLDFLCQEMGREINTTASKANNLDLTKIAIDLKNELERVREQVQNLE